METVMLKDGLAVGLRDASPDDEAFIFSSWLVSFRENGDWPRRIGKGRYFAEHKLTVTHLLASSRTLVACNPDRPSQVLGYAVASGRLVHWLYVKDGFRRMGIGALLAAEMAPWTRASHWTEAGDAFTAGALWDFVQYDPFALDAA